jgi:hypothetical protein
MLSNVLKNFVDANWQQINFYVSRTAPPLAWLRASASSSCPQLMEQGGGDEIEF